MLLLMPDLMDALITESPAAILLLQFLQQHMHTQDNGSGKVRQRIKLCFFL
jgi:hypothetical protein